MKGNFKNQAQSLRNRLMLALLFGALFASGCGPKVTNRTDDVAYALSSGAPPIATCSIFSSPTVSGKVSTYTGGSNDGIKIRLQRVAATFDTSGSVEIKFFRWRVSSGGFADLDSVPLEFRLEIPGSTVGSVGTAVSGYTTSLSGSYLATIRAQATQIQASSNSDFLRQLDIISYGLDQSWQALKVVMYDYNGTGSGATATVIGQIDSLLPSYDTDPNVYAQNHANTLLQLHPFYDYRSQNIDFNARAATMCL